MNTFNYFYKVTILQLFLRHSESYPKHVKIFLFLLVREKNCWFDTADKKFTPIRKWIWIAFAEKCTTSRDIRKNAKENAAISSTQKKTQN